mmetsp:Transcript_66662/g.124454  ORF Transcript_66662/g.124454 Transcript_66662/m.124454 type:complete len:800 (-) Transcript_66662:255-2654(-)
MNCLLCQPCGEAKGTEIDLTDESQAPRSDESRQRQDTAFWRAARDGDADKMATLIKSGVDVNAQDGESSPRSKNATALIHAAKGGHAEVVQQLLSVPGIQVNQTSDDEVQKGRCLQSALHWSARPPCYPAVTNLLLTHPDVDVNQKTAMGFTALQIACQNPGDAGAGVVAALVKDKRTDIQFFFVTPTGVQLDAVRVAMFDAFTDAVSIILNSGRADVPDLNKQCKGVSCTSTYINLAAELGHASIVRLMLDAKGDPSIPNSSGRTTLQVALDMDSTEIIMSLLCGSDGSSGCFTPFREAQILGDGVKLKDMLKAGTVGSGEVLPALHKAVLMSDALADLSKELSSLEAAGSHAADVVDGAGLPAVYWAIEEGHWAQVESLLTTAHSMPKDFVLQLLSGKFGQISKSASAEPGERVFEVFRSLLAEEARVTTDKQKAKGAFKLLHPFCASVIALQYFKKHEDNFAVLRDACFRESNLIYDRIDKEVGHGLLTKLAEVGKGENVDGIRQDDPGLMPPMGYYRNEKSGQVMAGNHELFAARSIALAAMGVTDLYVSDLRTLLAGIPVEMHPAPSKTYGRMYNKLMNKAEHGDPSIPKPRPMRNVDVIRCGLCAENADDLDRIFKAIKSKYRILRIKNTHDPTNEGYGGFRCILVNLAYDSGVKLKDLFGESPGFDNELQSTGTDLDAHVTSDSTSRKWRDYCVLQKPATDWLWGMQGLWYAARKEPERTFVISAEVQIIYAPYMRGRSLSHLLYKISRCETGPSEMARDFASSFVEETAELIERRKAVKSIAQEARKAAAA